MQRQSLMASAKTFIAKNRAPVCIVGVIIAASVVWITVTGSSDSPSEILSQAEKHLEEKKFQSAYDALLAAMRLAPSDKRVFELSIQFIRNVSEADDEDALLLGIDMHQRMANLIPFQPLSRLEEARATHSKIAEKLYPAPRGIKNLHSDSLTEVKLILAASRKPDLPQTAKLRLLQEVEAELGRQARRAALSDMKREDLQAFWDRWKDIKSKYDDAQEEVLTALYKEECGPRLVKWQEKVDEFFQNKAAAKVNLVHQTNKEIAALEIEGQRLGRDLMPYLNSGISSARKGNEERPLERDLTRLSRLREWNYNRWALDRIDKVKMSTSKNLEKLRSLSTIDEIRLAPFVSQQFKTTWEDIFDDCEDNEKIEATKIRILKEQ